MQIPNINVDTEKTLLIDNDIFLIEDSADSYNKKKVKRGNVSIITDGTMTGSGSVANPLTVIGSTQIPSILVYSYLNFY